MFRIQASNKRDMHVLGQINVAFLPGDRNQRSISELAYQVEEESTFGIAAGFLIRGSLFTLVHVEARY
jgi:hypothetical protein